MSVAFAESYAPPRLAEDDALARSEAHLDAMRTRRSIRDVRARSPCASELIENALRVAGLGTFGREPAAVDVRRRH